MDPRQQTTSRSAQSRNESVCRPAVLGRAAAVLLALGFGLSSCGDDQLKQYLHLLDKAAVLRTSRPGHRGLRTVQVRYDGHLRTQQEEIVDIAPDDLGARLVEVDGHAPSEAEQLVFIKDARNIFKYRDLSVDGVQRVTGNYNISTVNAGDSVAGRAAFHLRLDRRRNRGAAIDVWGDRESGVVLKVTRTSADGELLYSMAYDRIEIGGIERVEKDPPRLATPPAASKSSQGTFVPFDPTALPDGFTRSSDRRFAELQAGGQRFEGCVDVFTDGIQHLFVVQGNPEHDFWVAGQPGAARPPESTFLTASIASMNIVWVRREGRTLAAYGSFSEQLLGGILNRYHAPR
jgi:hypothetical protein